VPFTPSHAVVALPFAASRTLRTAGLPAAIAVGAMTPDLPLFLRIPGVSYAWTHDVAWIAPTALVAFALLLVWRCALRPAVRELAPRWLARRLPPAWDAGAAASARETVAPAAWRDLAGRALFPAVLAAALLFGVLTHIAWDLFTHEGRAGIPALDATWGPLPAYRWLQHGSSVLGLVVLAVAAVLWLRAARPGAAPRTVLPSGVRIAWWISLPALLVAAWAVGSAVLGPFTATYTPQHLAYQVLPPACGVWGGATVVLCLVVQLLRTGRSRG